MFGRMLPVKLFVPGGKENLPKSLHVVKIDEICNPDKYLLFKKKKEIKQLINCHYNTQRQFNSI